MDEKIIVYEHGFSRILDKHLDDASLSWTKRLTICIDVALAVEKLDSDGIGLRDIKSGSILIDKDWKAKVFNLEWSLKDPTCRQPSGKDHDSKEFLVILLEILCGRLDLGVSNSDELSFKSLVERHLAEEINLDELVFEGIKEKIDPESLDLFIQIVVGHCLYSPETLSAMVHLLEDARAKQEYVEKIPHILVEEIKLATHNFSEEKCIGVGKYWKLYEGEFPHSANYANTGHTSMTTLVKRWDGKSNQGRRQFFKELKIHFENKNENIIAIEGYCSEKDEQIIVFEHGYNKSLDKHLDDSSLSWTKRLNICINVATALDFLHNLDTSRQKSMIHGDIKSGSILVDGDWNAKVYNFKVSSSDGEDNNSLGYVDPDQHQGSSMYKDIYSFSVVLLEMLCGRLAWPEGCENHSQSLGPLAQRHYKEKRNFDELVFEGIKEQISPESLITYQRIAMNCMTAIEYRQPKTDLKDRLKDQWESQEIAMADVEYTGADLKIAYRLKDALLDQEYVEKSPLILVEEIKSATHNFSAEKCIGEGKYWKLYEGEFPHSANYANTGYTTRTALVKRWDGKSVKGRQQFFKELKMHFWHKDENIVAVEGYCSEKDDKIIVYEHAYNRSLDKHLDGTSLSWTTRLNICIDVATALDLLHNGRKTWGLVRIHGDIKSGSFLIDANWHAKVHNFEVFNEEHKSPLDYNGHPLWGFDPLNQRQRMRKDVYSVGVVLLEMLCGRLDVISSDQDHDSRSSLVTLAQRHFKEKGNLHELVVEGINENEPICLDSMIVFQQIALICVADTEEMHPVAEEILEQLKNALELQRCMLGNNGERNQNISARMFSYKNGPSHIWQTISESRFLSHLGFKK
uniref:uncharacterized protein LOC122587613 n=1 Tax=Erigeron canadensis TaxID=72917 RepID=UPI001CB8A407|nr:uncharacterized protein LOC122587613 [Erigeron canadensis]